MQERHNETVSPNSTKLHDWLRTGALCGSPKGRLKLTVGPFRNPGDGVLGGRVWLSPPFFHNRPFSDYRRVGSEDFEVDAAEIEKSIQLKALPQNITRWSSPDLQTFQASFLRAQALMQTGQLEKVVPVVFESTPIEVTAQMVQYWLTNALQGESQGFLFGMWNLDDGWGVLGLTPELLFQRQGREIRTMALAGTARSSEHHLLSDPKEMLEHQIVSREIEKSLATFGSVDVGVPYEWQPSSMRHLRTDIFLHSKDDVSDFEILRNLHPTPALGGTPRAEAMRLLADWDHDQSRSVFGAPFGWLDEASDTSEFVVAIRCLIWRDGVLKIGSGCGLVQESDFEKEWDELSRKRQSVKKIFGVKP